MKKVDYRMTKSSLLTMMIMLMIGLISQACIKLENTEIEKQNSHFTVKDGMLEFKTIQDFMIIKDSVSKLSEIGIENFEKLIGFKTQASILKNIIQAEIDIDEVNQSKYTYEQAKKINPDLLHSNLYYKYLKAGVIEVYNKGTEDEYWDMPFYQKLDMEIIGERGIYLVKDSTISVNGKGNLTSKNWNPGLINSGWKYGGTSNKRAAIQVYLYTFNFDWVTCAYSFYHDIYVQAQDKNWLGSWKYSAPEGWINAYWEIRAYWGNDLAMQSSWNYHGSPSNFKASINPSNGNNPGFQYYFTITPPYWHYPVDPLMEEDTEPTYTVWDPDWVQYQYIRVGGDHGIYATIPAIDGEQ